MNSHRYVFGITHVPRLEDWPVMPVEHIGFHLMVVINSHLLIFIYLYHSIYAFLTIYTSRTSIDKMLIRFQPHGFFNSSPAVDVPPSSLPDSELKENGIVDKAYHSGLVAKM